MSATATPTANKVSPDVNVAGMKAGDADVKVAPVAGGGLVLSPLPVGGRRRKTAKKAGRRRRGGADEEPMVAARRRRTAKKSKKAGRR